MISTSTFAFVLAFVAVASVVAVSIILLRHMLRTDSSLATMRSDFVSFSASVNARVAAVEKQSPTKLAAEVAALSEAVARHSEIHRRFAGRVWQRIGRNEPQHDGFEVDVTNDTSDDEITALLRLQSAPAASPGKR